MTFIQITGQGTVTYPYKSYHQVTKKLDTEGNLICYILPWGNDNYVYPEYATEIEAIPTTYAVIFVPGSDNTIPMKIDPEYLFNGISGNQYASEYVYQNGNTTGMPKAFALEYNNWYTKFGSQFNY